MSKLTELKASIERLKVATDTLSEVHQKLLKKIGGTQEGLGYCYTLEMKIKRFREVYDEVSQFALEYETTLNLLKNKWKVGLYLAGALASLYLYFKWFFKRIKTYE